MMRARRRRLRRWRRPISISLFVMLSLAYFSNQAMVIFIKFHGHKIPLSVEATDKISNVKALITLEEGITRDQQHLTFKDQQLENDSTLTDYNIHNGDTLHLVEKDPPNEQQQFSKTIKLHCTAY